MQTLYGLGCESYGLGFEQVKSEFDVASPVHNVLQRPISRILHHVSVLGRGNQENFIRIGLHMTSVREFHVE